MRRALPGSKLSLTLTPVAPGVARGFRRGARANGQTTTKELKMKSIETGYKFKLGFPTPATTQKANDANDLRRAVEAYKFYYPTVATESVMQQFVPHGLRPNRAGIIMAQDPEQQFAYANQDTPYIICVFDLKATGPMVIDLPAGPYISALNDHNEEWCGDLGQNGPSRGRADKGLLLPPGHEGELPVGYTPFYPRTWKVVFACRVVSDSGDYEESVAWAKKVQIYPLSEAGKTPTFEIIDIGRHTAAPSPILRWEKRLKYWRRLHKVLCEETDQEKFRVTNGMLAQLGIEKGEPFPDDDERLKDILLQAAQIGFDEMNVTYFANPLVEEKIVWADKQWEYLPVTGALDLTAKEYGDASARYLLTSDAFYWVGWGVSGTIGARKAGGGSMYFTTPRDADGRYLAGGKRYTLRLPHPMPADQFWSVTVYDSETRCIIDSGQGRGAVRSMHEHPKVTWIDDDRRLGYYEITFGSVQPPADKEDNWIQTIPGKGWLTCVRLYGPTESVFNGRFQLPDIEMVE